MVDGAYVHKSDNPHLIVIIIIMCSVLYQVLFKHHNKTVVKF